MTKAPRHTTPAPSFFGSDIEPVEGLSHPAYGEVGDWITKAMAEEPSGGTLGRMELLKIWDRLPVEARKKLVQAGRVLMLRERTPEP